MQNPMKYLSIVTGATFISASPLSAALVFYDSFTEGSTPLTLPGHTPDTGGADWANAQNTTAVGDTQISAGSLADPTGLALSATGGKLTAITDDDYRGFSSLSGGGLGADGTTVYVSALVDLAAGGSAATGIEFRRGATNATSHGAARSFFIGSIGSTYAAQTQIAGASGSAALTPGQVNFVVARFNFVAGNDSIDVWVNPADAADLAGPADGTISGADFSFNHVAFSNFNSTAFGSVDEVRIGTELSDVTSIPEPSTVLLGLSGSLLLLRLRRRR